MHDGSLMALASFITLHPDHSATTVVRAIQGKIIAPVGKAGAGGLAAAQAVPKEGFSETRRDQQILSTTVPHEKAEYKYGPPPEEPAGDGRRAGE